MQGNPRLQRVLAEIRAFATLQTHVSLHGGAAKGRISTWDFEDAAKEPFAAAPYHPRPRVQLCRDCTARAGVESCRMDLFGMRIDEQEIG